MDSTENLKEEDGHKNFYAIIYGCGNKPGGAFANFLADKGFNLILIDRNV